MSRRTHSTLALVGLTVSTSAWAQLPSPVILTSPRLVSDAAFVRIRSVHQLAPDCVLVLDVGQLSVWRVDPRSRARAFALGMGSSPRAVDPQLSLSGVGAVAALDDLGGNITYFGAHGNQGSVLSTDSLFLPPPLVSPRFKGMDRQGNLYFELPTVVIDPASGARGVDSSAILRVNPRTRRADTLGFVQLPPGSTRATGGRPGEGLVFFPSGNHSGPRDSWVPAPDGRVAVVHVQPYRVEWIGPRGARVRGPVVHVDSLAITGALTARIDRRGRLWVERAGFAGDTPGGYDVFDAAGKVVARYVLPERTTVVGFGPSTVYAKHTTDDGERLVAFSIR
jgi:hypothetical protein